MKARRKVLSALGKSSAQPPADHPQNVRKIAKLHARALSQTARGRYAGAIKAFRRALRLADSLHTSEPLVTAALLNDFGVACKFAGRFAEASRAYRRALRLTVQSAEASAQQDSVATLYHNLGGIAHAQGRLKEALRYARRGIAIRKQIGLDAVSLAADEAALAAILADSGRGTEAKKYYLRALRIFRARLGPQDYEVGAALANLGAVYSKMKRPDAAERSLRRGVSILEGALGRRHPRVAMALNNLAFVCARRGKIREAERLYTRVLRIMRDQPRSAYPQAAMVRGNLSKLHRMMAEHEREPA